jgi:hypothetical protein
MANHIDELVSPSELVNWVFKACGRQLVQTDPPRKVDRAVRFVFEIGGDIGDQIRENTNEVA